MKVYLAGQYARRDEFRGYKELIEQSGIEVTSRWLLEKEPLTTQMGDHSKDFYAETATIDIEDIDKADFVIFFSEDPLKGIPRGGRHVEFGYAVGTHKPIHVVGPKENVFHYLGKPYRVFHHETLDDLLAVYKGAKTKYDNPGTKIDPTVESRIRELVGE